MDPLPEEDSLQAVSAAEAAESHARARWGTYTILFPGFYSGLPEVLP